MLVIPVARPFKGPRLERPTYARGGTRTCWFGRRLAHTMHQLLAQARARGIRWSIPRDSEWNSRGETDGTARELHFERKFEDGGGHYAFDVVFEQDGRLLQAVYLQLDSEGEVVHSQWCHAATALRALQRFATWATRNEVTRETTA